MNRNYGLDLARIFLCICVIALHSITNFNIENGTVFNIVLTFLASSNGVFYMLSGYFNLEKEFNNSTDIKNYYKNKFIYILFPFLAFLFVWAVWDYLHLNDTFNIIDFFWYYYELVMDTSSNGHLWFLYPLFGMLLATPFLSKMLHSMDDKELKILWRIAIGWNIVYYFLCLDIHIDFGFSGWFLISWPIYYFIGYYYRHIISRESVIKWSVLGIIGFVGTIVAPMFMDRFEGTNDMQPLFTLFCIGCLLFWDKTFKIKNNKFAKIIVYLSSQTFLVYLYHMRGMEYALRKLPVADSGLGTGLLVVFGTFIFSLIAAIVTNLCMKPVQKLMDRKWVIK